MSVLPTYEESEKGSLDISRHDSNGSPAPWTAKADDIENVQEAPVKSSKTRHLKGFAASLGFLTLLSLALLAALGKTPQLADEHAARFFPYLAGVLVMIYVGFGFLMTFLKRYSLSAVSLNMVLSALVTLLAVICMGFEKQGFRYIEVDLPLLIDASFAAGAAMISFGALIGFASPAQMVWLLALETPIYAAGVYTVIHAIGAFDVGGSITIHAFGAFYGLAASVVISRSSKTRGGSHPKNGSSRRSDLTSLIGTLFLWIYWPAFNAALASSEATTPAEEHRQPTVIASTLLSLLGSTLVTFTLSPLVSHGLDMVHIQNATLAGGVAIGSSAALRMPPVAALLVGLIAGGISTLGFRFASPWVESKLKIADTCGVLDLHGMPGLLGGIASAVLASACYASNEDILEHSASTQAGLQIGGLAAAVGIAIAGGLLGGALVSFIKVPGFAEESEGEEEMFYDDAGVIKSE